MDVGMKVSFITEDFIFLWFLYSLHHSSMALPIILKLVIAIDSVMDVGLKVSFVTYNFIFLLSLIQPASGSYKRSIARRSEVSDQ